MGELAGLLRPGDLLVVNDAATMPASLRGSSRLGPVEARLAGGGEKIGEWWAVLFGEGTWKETTEERAAPPALAHGDLIRFGDDLRARVRAVSELSPRLVELRFECDEEEIWPRLYAAGRPVQYSYLRGPVPLRSVQTPFAGRPWAVEMPSAGRALVVPLLGELRRRGVGIASVTHAAGLSSTGDPVLDAALPLPERYAIPEATVAAVAGARATGGRVVAVGTTVVRALEGSSASGGGALRAGEGVTDLRIGPGFAPKVVAGLLTGIHEPGSSHFELLQAFAPAGLLDAAFRHAEAEGYLGHEFGDLSLVLAA